MPINSSIKKILVLGSGPIVIGQGAEFDYSGTQCCETIREEGIEVVLLNSNPATIMTDREVADKIYIEPMNIKTIEKIFKKEQIDSIVIGMGGQTALNLGLELFESKLLEKYRVKILGTDIEGIIKGEDREAFKELMEKIGEPVVESYIAENLETALEKAEKIGYPIIVRPAYTLGGAGGGIAESDIELEIIVKQGLSYSPVNQVLIEKCIKGWKEIEYEIIRDEDGNTIAVCNMENLDPVGIHTGDSIVVAPSQTLSDYEYQMLRTSAIKIVDAVGVKGGCNVQFALHPESFEYGVIEINPRVSRSSALASKATGYPIAKVASKIALGYRLDEIVNQVTKKTYACFEPSLDYVVIKIPKWPFDKFKLANRELGTQMMATGEIMAIGSNFKSALLKGIRSLEIGKYKLTDKNYSLISIEKLRELIFKASDERLFALAELFRRGYSISKIQNITKIDYFFLNQINDIVKIEMELAKKEIGNLDKSFLLALKKQGFSDVGISELLEVNTAEIMKLRNIWQIKPVYKMVDTCSAEFEAISSYYYSTYDSICEVKSNSNKKIIVVGSGPIRIGQGIEFDYASVHCIKSLRKQGYETIMVNNNPETVSTDFNISDRLYFEPITIEDVMGIIEKENPLGVMLQFGGQTSIKLAKELELRGVNVLGTKASHIESAENRESFDNLLGNLEIERPMGKAVSSVEEGLKEAERLGYPLLVRPSYVIGGQGMEIGYDEKVISRYLENGFINAPKEPILIDKYICGNEIEIDAISDSEDVLIVGIIEHIEKAGIHSGDSMTYYPAQNISVDIENEILEITNKISRAIGFKGMINIQFIELNKKIYVIEINLRASRTVPYLSKMSGLNIVELATKVIMGQTLKELGIKSGYYPKPNMSSVKMPIFSTLKLKNVEVSLGPEMKSTGEVLGIGKNNIHALCNAYEACGTDIKLKEKKILLTLRREDQECGVDIAKQLLKHGVSIYATEGTSEILKNKGISCIVVRKRTEQKPNIEDMIEARCFDIILNTPTIGNNSYREGFIIRRKAIEFGVTIFTSIEAFQTVIAVNEEFDFEKELEPTEIVNELIYTS